MMTTALIFIGELPNGDELFLSRPTDKLFRREIAAMGSKYEYDWFYVAECPPSSKGLSIAHSETDNTETFEQMRKLALAQEPPRIVNKLNDIIDCLGMLLHNTANNTNAYNGYCQVTAEQFDRGRK